MIRPLLITLLFLTMAFAGTPGSAQDEPTTYTLSSSKGDMQPLNVNWVEFDGVRVTGVEGTGHIQIIEMSVKSPPKGITWDGQYYQFQDGDHIIIADFTGDYFVGSEPGNIKLSGAAEAWGYCDGFDSDNDRLGDCQETYAYGTDPNDYDTDGDGLGDGDEVLDIFTNPLDADTDDDGALDGAEVNTLGTDPFDADTDDDGLTDGAEVTGSENNAYANEPTDPLDADSDDDGLTDGDEVLVYGTDPNNADTDGEGLTDGDEVNAGTDPTDSDTDDDGLTDFQEKTGSTNAAYGNAPTDPTDADSDDDGLTDGTETLDVGTDPNDADTDGGGKDDGTEVLRGTDPFDPSDDAYFVACSLSGQYADCGTAMDIEVAGANPNEHYTDGTYTLWDEDFTFVVDGAQWFQTDGTPGEVGDNFRVTMTNFRGTVIKSTDGVQDLLQFDGIAQSILVQAPGDDEELVRERFTVENDQEEGKLKVSSYGILLDEEVLGESYEIPFAVPVPIYYEFDFWKHEDDLTNTGNFYIVIEDGTHQGQEGTWIRIYNDDPYVQEFFVPTTVPVLGGTSVCIALC